MRDSLFFILAIASGLLIYCSLRFIIKYTSDADSIIEIHYDDVGRIMIPMRVNGISYMFQWDTGASASIFTANNMENHLDSAVVSILMQKRDCNVAISNDKSINIGDFEFSSKFLLMDSTCVIGGNIINNFYWYFDFVNAKCKISDNPITINDNDLIKLSIDFEKFNKTPVCDIEFNTGLKARFFFDTGHQGGALVGVTGSSTETNIHTVLNIDIFITSYDTTSNAMKFFNSIVSQEQNTEIEMHGDVGGAILNGISINNSYMTLFLRYDENLFYKEDNQNGVIGYITSNFIKRFDFMYYDPFNNKIELYANKNKLHQLLGENIYRFIESITNSEYPFKVKKTDYEKYLHLMLSEKQQL